MTNRLKTAAAASLMGLGLVLSAAPASAAPGNFEVVLYDGAGNAHPGVNGRCPATGGARSVKGINNSVARYSVTYRVIKSPCKLTIFDHVDGSGLGVGLQRDGKEYGLGVARLRAYSIVSYGS